MTDLLIQSVGSRGDTFPRVLLDGCRPSVVARYSRSGDSLGAELKHSKSDDLVLQGASFIQPDLHHVRCDSPIPKTACVVYEDDLVSTHVLPKTKYFSDSETEVDIRPSSIDRATRKISGDFSSDIQRTPSRHVGLYDRVDPEDSIRDMITENDFYRFVLFKRHYEKYLRLSQKYEEARNIAYYLEEKYHEIKAERDGLTQARLELKRKLDTRELELHEKEEELFLQLERVVRLEEDCEKLRTEKEKFGHWKDQLEKEKNEAYRQLKRQVVESEATRRGLERARQEVMRQVTAIAAEKDSLEKENEKLKETLHEERRGVGHYLVDLTQQKRRISQNMEGLEKEVMELKFISRQSASLNNQFKKGMKHLATCKRKKCSVCAYTKATFGEYVDRNDKKLLSCFQAPLQDLRNWMRPVPLSTSVSEDEDRKGGNTSSMSRYSAFLVHSSPFPSTRSEYSFRRAYSSETQTSASSPSPTPSLPLECLGDAASSNGFYPSMATGASGPLPYISYIDEASTSSDSSSEDSGHGEESYAAPEGPACRCVSVPTDTSLTSTSSTQAAARAFSSDSGFSSELYDTGRRSLHSNANKSLAGRNDGDPDKPPPPLLQRSKWTSSFRKLINKVSKR